jgi:hypothetical protein
LHIPAEELLRFFGDEMQYFFEGFAFISGSINDINQIDIG